MGRGKLPMEYITTEKARKSSFKKRKEGLVKKIRELSILCGIDACLIIYGPRNNNDGVPMEVHTWPKECKEVESILRKYGLKRNESSSKHLNLMDFFGNQTCKINEQIVKTRREIAKAKFARRMELGLEGVSADELKDMLMEVDKKMETVTSCIEAEREKQKMSRGLRAVELMKLGNVQILDSIFKDDASKIDIAHEYYNAQAYIGEHFKPLQLSVPDCNPYLPLPSLTDSFLTQNNYQTDLLADLNANDLSEYVVGPSNFSQFQGPNCEPQYFQTSLYAADALKNYGMGYLAAQQQQQSVSQGNCFQSADCCCAFGDCYGNFCGWRPERNI